MEKAKKRVFIILFTAVIIGNNTFTLSFEDLAVNLNKSYDVQSARLQLENAEKTVTLNRYPGDISFSLNPSVKTITETGASFPGETDFYGSSSLKIPLGLSDSAKEQLKFSIDAMELTAEAVETAKRKAFLTLHSLYQQAWLLQEEESVLFLELEAAQNQVETLTQQYKNGNIPLSVLSSAEQNLQDKMEEKTQEQLKQRVTLYELAFTSNSAVREEPLERYELDVNNLPSPPELSLWVPRNHPDIKAQKTKVDQIRQTIERLNKTDISVSVKPFFISGDHSVSLEYSTGNPELTATYSFPLYTAGSVPVSDGKYDDTWETGLTISLALNADKKDSLNSIILKTELQQEIARLDYLTNYINLQIRSSYQQYLKAQDSLDQAKRNLKRSMDNKKIVETKASLGQTSEYEIKEADAMVKRDEWRVESARIEVEKSYLNTAYTAAWGELYE